MEKINDLEKLLKEAMSPCEADVEMPDPSLVHHAREIVRSRKKTVTERYGFFTLLTEFFKLELKFYHVGLTVLLISAGIFYVNEPNYNNTDAAGLIQYNEALSIKNNTTSVNSSTMLTSIPTLVIRN